MFRSDKHGQIQRLAVEIMMDEQFHTGWDYKQRRKFSTIQ